MTFDQRNSPARRRRISEGRAKMAIVATSAAVLGGAAGVGVPAIAGDSAIDTACNDPARTTQTITLDGRLVDCDTLTDAAAAAGDGTTSGESTPTTPTDVVADPPVSTPVDPPAGPPQGVPANPPANPQPGAGTPAVTSPGPQAPGASTSAPGDTPVVGHESGRPTGADLAKAKAKAKAKAHARTEARDRALAKAKAKARAKAKAKAKAKARAKRLAAKKQGLTDAAIYASLPPSWTSLAPLSLPAFTVDSFPIPPFLLPVYQAAAAQYGVPWEVLASINEIESNFGRNLSVSSAGALGWMQFIRSSWARWGMDGDGDHRRDPRNPVDAIFAAARYLHDAGAATDLPKAIYAYNHADWYVNRVVERAREFAGLDPLLVSALAERALREDAQLYRAKGNPFAGKGAIAPSPGQALMLSKRQLVRLVLRSDDIKIYPEGRRDIADGHVNRRVLATLLFLARSGLKPTVSCLISGHSLYTTSGNISAHSYGHAVDISAINGVPILGHQGAGSITDTTLQKLIELQGYFEPNQIISLMTVDGHDNTLAMADHNDHIHVGFSRVPWVQNTDRPADIRDIVATFRDESATLNARTARSIRAARIARAAATMSHRPYAR